MRLTPDQIAAILAVSRSLAGVDACIWLYGSRLDDAGRGGDVDLLLEPAQPLSLLQRARLKHVLEQHLRLPVDVLTHQPGTADTPFVAVARKRARLLSAAA